MLDKHMEQQARHALEENVEQNSHRVEWPVYEYYKFIIGEAGKQYLYAPPAGNGIKKRLQPLSRVSADLFLRFAHWVENPGMDKELETERNARAAKMWAEDYGVLGLNDPDETIVGLMNSHRVTADYLGMPWRGGGANRGRRNTARGGRPQESIENFAFEAWEAHIVWRIYESVRSREVVDVPSVSQFMSTFDQGEPPITASWVERDIYSQDTELTRQWALTIVEDAVNRKIEDCCYPIVQGVPSSYHQSWGFKSLLGALWLQMMFLMRADRRCWHCGRPIDPGRRSHAKFCDNDGKCKANYAYHSGGQKEAKEQKRRLGYRGSASSSVT